MIIGQKFVNTVEKISVVMNSIRVESLQFGRIVYPSDRSDMLEKSLKFLESFLSCHIP
ncbi:hypothetical protein AVEN_85557-1, partial [Araneus ventricosus]